MHAKSTGCKQYRHRRSHWSNANVPQEKVVNRGMGMHFVNNTEQSRARLGDAISASFEDSDFNP